ncbi:hypothetical protein P3W45_000659 [Vairimorpha bombi]
MLAYFALQDGLELDNGSPPSDPEFKSSASSRRRLNHKDNQDEDSLSSNGDSTDSKEEDLRKEDNGYKNNKEENTSNEETPKNNTMPIILSSNKTPPTDTPSSSADKDSSHTFFQSTDQFITNLSSNDIAPDDSFDTIVIEIVDEYVDINKDLLKAFIYSTKAILYMKKDLLAMIVSKLQTNSNDAGIQFPIYLSNEDVECVYKYIRCRRNILEVNYNFFKKMIVRKIIRELVCTFKGFLYASETLNFEGNPKNIIACNQHIIRYLKESISNTFSSELRDVIYRENLTIPNVQSSFSPLELSFYFVMVRSKDYKEFD